MVRAVCYTPPKKQQIPPKTGKIYRYGIWKRAENNLALDGNWYCNLFSHSGILVLKSVFEAAVTEDLLSLAEQGTTCALKRKFGPHFLNLVAVIGKRSKVSIFNWQKVSLVVDWKILLSKFVDWKFVLFEFVMEWKLWYSLEFSAHYLIFQTFFIELLWSYEVLTAAKVWLKRSVSTIVKTYLFTRHRLPSSIVFIQ